MDEDEFWNVIGAARDASTDFHGRPDALREQLKDRAPEDLQDFYELYRDQIDKSYRWDLWGAAYIVNGGCSDDGFDYFRDWLVSEGREAFEKVLNDPEALADWPTLEEVELEEMRYVADELYEAKTGGAMTPRERSYASDPAGEPWEEDNVQELFPRLAKKYWGD